jgi:hypothetical protein
LPAEVFWGLLVDRIYWLSAFYPQQVVFHYFFTALVGKITVLYIDIGFLYTIMKTGLSFCLFSVTRGGLYGSLKPALGFERFLLQGGRYSHLSIYPTLFENPVTYPFNIIQPAKEKNYEN